MRLEVLEAEAGSAPPLDRQRTRRWHVSAADWLILAAFMALSLVTVAIDLSRAHTLGLVWTHTDGFYPVDQMQYLSWVRSASHHFLVSNFFVLQPGPADYFQPAVVISAGLTLLGVAPWLALMVWKPVAVVCTFFAFRWYVRRGVSGGFARWIALVLAIFYASYSYFYGGWGVIGDLMTVFLSWGYTFGLLAGALMVFSLLTYDRTRERERVALVPGLLGAVAGLLHPWQGEMLVALLVGTEAALWVLTRRLPRNLLRTPLLTLVLTGLPLVYYELLGRSDPWWKAAREASKHSFSMKAILIALAPLLIAALVAIWPRRFTFYEVVTRVWLGAAVAIWLLSASALSATPLHAVQGISLPLAVLATQGVQRLRLGRLRLERLPGARAVAVVVAGLLTVPATIKLYNEARYIDTPWPGNANFINPRENDALKYLANDPRPGGVMTRSYLGVAVPALTDRQTFIGDCLWSQPNCGERWNAMQNLIHGKLPPAQAQQLVRASGTRFVLSDCRANAPLTSTLGPLLVSERHFGCATVYEVRPPAPGSPSLSESALDAALRLTGRKQR